MDSTEIQPLIRETVSRHCDDRRLENVINNILRDVLQRQYYKKPEGRKAFRKRYKELILDGFREELERE